MSFGFIQYLACVCKLDHAHAATVQLSTSLRSAAVRTSNWFVCPDKGRGRMLTLVLITLLTLDHNMLNDDTLENETEATRRRHWPLTPHAPHLRSQRLARSKLGAGPRSPVFVHISTAPMRPFAVKSVHILLRLLSYW